MTKLRPAVCLLLILALDCFVKASWLLAKDKEAIVSEALDAALSAQNAQRPGDLPANTIDNSLLLVEEEVLYETKVFSLRYIKVADVKTAIDSLLSPDTGSVVYDEALNQLSVTDLAENLETIAEKVAELDKKTEIAFVGQIVKILLNEEHIQGIDWEAIVSHYQAIAFGPKDPDLSGQLSLGTISQEDFKVLFEALEAAGKVETIGQPSVTVKPYQEAGIPLTLTKPLKLLLPADVNTKQLKDQTSAEFFLEFVFTPAWPEEKMLSLNLNPQFHWTQDESQKQSPKDTTVSSGSATVSKTDMLVIGGLFQTKDVLIETRVPVVGDLPVLGAFFRGQRPSVEKTEFVIFLTPKVMVEEAAENPL